jgi:guanosine-3',5'-bis(diphosphate) 3'-pyrophosphohydrolase
MNNKKPGMMEMRNLQIIFDALEFAARKHQFQKRKGAAGIPYVNHLIEVTALLVRKLKSPSSDLLVAALLHDVLEDTDTREEEIEKRFGKTILDIVSEVSDDMSLPSSTRKALQIEDAKHLSYEACCIKIADKTCNIRDILYTRVKWNRKRKMKYIRWAVNVIQEIRDTDTNLIDEFDKAVKESEEILEMN